MTDIKEVLHFYLGSNVRYRYVDWEPGHYTAWLVLTGNVYDKIMNDASIEGVQIETRPLSDMTEKEIRYWMDFAGIKEELESYTWETEIEGEPCIPHWNLAVKKADGSPYGLGYRIGGIDQIYHPSIFAYLINRGFDLFGLLESGQAINKPKLNQHDTTE